jgi:hypothetical protein
MRKDVSQGMAVQHSSQRHYMEVGVKLYAPGNHWVEISAEHRNLSLGAAVVLTRSLYFEDVL